MSTRRDELFAKEAFAEHLRTRGCLDVGWEPGSDPPDFFLMVQGQTYAVEVTQVMESLGLGSLVISERGAISALRRAVGVLEADAKKANLLRGFYHLHACPLPDLRHSLPDIRSHLFDYLADTANMEKAEEVTIWNGGKGQAWTVEKVHARGSDLVESMSTGGAKWGGEVRDELTRLLASAISTKESKSATITQPKLLLLVDAYHYADADDWGSVCLPEEAAPFHTIARIYQERSCQVLASQTGAWR